MSERPKDERPKGRELDAAIAREVFGLDVRRDEDHRHRYRIVGVSPFAYQFRLTDDDRGGDPNAVPYFHTNIAAAWKILEKGGHRYGVPILFRLQLLNDGPHCRMGWKNDNGEVFQAYGSTFPEVISRAALTAVRATPNPATADV